MEHPRTKISVTLAPDLVRAVDRAAKRHSPRSRSAVIEAWLRRAARLDLEDRLRADTIAYYEGLSTHERSEDAAIARSASRAARRLRLDDD
ncbi:MAG TPA: ribbon-helix-helix protein, CopG family [Polyangiaceae bacterium]|nr:ribbon-helix-helix protein, CopG family [Polyangiaceae bacterium]